MTITLVTISAGESNDYPNQCVSGFVRNTGSTSGSFTMLESAGQTLSRTLVSYQTYTFQNIYLKKITNTGTTDLEVEVSNGQVSQSDLSIQQLDIGAINGTVNVNGSVTISGTTDVNITNSSLTVSGNVTVNGTIDANITNSSLTVSGNVTISGITDVNITNSTLTVSGSVTISGTTDVNITNSTLTISGNVNITNSSIPITTSGSLDVNVVNSSIPITTSGTLDVNVSNSSITIASNPNTNMVSEYNVSTTANTDILTTSLTPDTTPVNFELTISVATADQIILVRYNGTNTYTSAINQGRYLSAGSEYNFSFTVHSGDTINIRTLHANTLNILAIDEVAS